MIRGPEATIMRRSWRRGPSQANHVSENLSNVHQVRATACNAVLFNFALILHVRVPPMSGKDICPALPALTLRQLVPVNLVSAVGKSVT